MGSWISWLRGASEVEVTAESATGQETSTAGVAVLRRLFWTVREATVLSLRGVTSPCDDQIAKPRCLEDRSSAAPSSAVERCPVPTAVCGTPSATAPCVLHVGYASQLPGAGPATMAMSPRERMLWRAEQCLKRDATVCVTSGVAYGCDFMCYRGDPHAMHAAWLVKVVPRGYSPSPLELVCAARVANTCDKRLLYMRCLHNDGDDHPPDPVFTFHWLAWRSDLAYRTVFADSRWPLFITFVPSALGFCCLSKARRQRDMDRAAALEKWVLAEGARFDGVAAQPMADMGGGFGVVATQRLRKGKVVCAIPANLILTTRVAKAVVHERAPTSTTATVSPVAWIVSFLVRERHYTPAKTERHRFALWIDGLPSCYDNAMEASPNTTSHLGFPRYIAKWHVEQDACRRLYDTCVASGLLPAAPSDDEGAAYRKFVWGYNSLMSRGFSYDDDVWCMMPWVDYFNYSVDSNLSLTYDEVKNRYEFRATRDVAAGDQLFLRYGTYNDMELRTWYGFHLCAPDASQHQDACSYAFAPTADVDGALPVNEDWARLLCEQAALPLTSTKFSSQFSAKDVRVFHTGVSYDFGQLLRAIEAALTSEGEETFPTRGHILHRLVLSELQSVRVPADLEGKQCACDACHVRKDACALLTALVSLGPDRLGRVANTFVP